MKKFSTLLLIVLTSAAFLGSPPANASQENGSTLRLAVPNLPPLPDNAPIEMPPVPDFAFADKNASVKADFDTQIESVKKDIRAHGGGKIVSITRTMYEPTSDPAAMAEKGTATPD